MNFEKLKNTASNAKVYWKRPMPGRYMPFKEIFAYSFGGIGIYFLIYCVGQLTLSTQNVIIGNAIGINPEMMYALYIISLVVSFPATGLRATIIDNARSKKGKYRPYLLYMALPACLLVIGMVMVPYEKIESQLLKGAIVLFFNIGFQFFYMFFYDSYENLIMVLSPDTTERSDVLGIKSVVYSLAPSIATAILPLAAKALTDNNMYDMKLYRVLFPPFAILGVIAAVYIFSNTEEKIVQARTHVVHIKFLDAIRAVAKNKLFWVISLAGWVGFLEGTYGNMLSWAYSYHNDPENGGISAGLYTIVTMVVSNANMWGMIAAPFAIRKWGKKNVLIVTNAINAFCLMLLYPVVKIMPDKMILYIALVLFFNYLMTSFGVILTPAVNADIRDYQQYITGERIDGMFAAVGLIGTIITAATSGIVPSVYKSLGINDTVVRERAAEIFALHPERFKGGIDEVINNSWNVLYINDIFKQVFIVVVILSAVGAVMNVIPYFFYDMTEQRQRAIVKVLQLRAMFEDFGNGLLNDKDIVSTIDMIEFSKKMYKQEPKDINALKAAKKKAANSAEKKLAKRAIKEARIYNDDIEISKLVMQELNKFSTPEWQFKLEEAKKLNAAGLDGLTADSFEHLQEVLANAKAMPKTSKMEKEERSASITSAKNRIYSKKTIEEKYDGKIEEFDATVFEALFDREDENLAARTALEEKISVAKSNMKESKSAGDKAYFEEQKKLIEDYKTQIAELKKEKAKNDAEIKKATDENSVYNRLAKPYIDAKNLVAQAENYTHYEEIKGMYDEAKERYEAQLREEEEAAKALAAEQKAVKEKMKEEKAAKKAEKKSKK